MFLAGGDPDMIEKLRPILASLSDNLRRYPTAALALAAKLTNNLLLLSEIVALAESLAVGRSGGLSDDELRDLLENSPRCPSEVRSASHVGRLAKPAQFESTLTPSCRSATRMTSTGRTHRACGRWLAGGSPQCADSRTGAGGSRRRPTGP
jgi:3-hydroxyisobutyrate dehydrogenase-like beta-hydroxyacid dehydrogenase